MCVCMCVCVCVCVCVKVCGRSLRLEYVSLCMHMNYNHTFYD